MGASCSSSSSPPSSSPPRHSSTSSPFQCLPHHHRPIQHSSSPYPKSPLARLHSYLPSSPFPCLNGLLRLKRGLLRIDPFLSLSPPSSNAVHSFSSLPAHSHLHVSVLLPTDNIAELMCRTPVGSFAYFLHCPLPHPTSSLSLPLHIAYHYHPRQHTSSSSHPSTTLIHTAQTGLTIQLHPTSTSPNAVRRETADIAFPSHHFTARMSEKHYRRLEKLSFSFLPLLRSFLLEATRHPSFTQPEEKEKENSSPSFSSFDSPPLHISSYTDKNRTGLLLSFPSLRSSFHVDCEWRREQPRLNCRELGVLIDDSIHHSFSCFVIRGWMAAGGNLGEEGWRLLGLDAFSISPSPLFFSQTKVKASLLSTSSSCCPPLSFPLLPSSPLYQSASPPPSSVDSRCKSFDRHYLISFLYEYSIHYAGTIMIDGAVTALLTPKRGSTQVTGVNAKEEGGEGKGKLGVQEMLIKVLETIKSCMLIDDEARLLQWCIECCHSLLHVLCLHSSHHKIVHTCLAILQLMARNVACHSPMQRMMNEHLRRHRTCQGGLLALFSLLTSSSAFCSSIASSSTLPRLLWIHSHICSLMFPPSALSLPVLPSLPCEMSPLTRRPSRSKMSRMKSSSSSRSPPRVQAVSPPRQRMSVSNVSNGNGKMAPSTHSNSPHRQRSSSAAPHPSTVRSAAHLLNRTPTAGLTVRSVSFHRPAYLPQPAKEEEGKREEADFAGPLDTPTKPERGDSGPRGILKNSPVVRPRDSPTVQSEDEKEEEGGSDGSEGTERRLTDRPSEVFSFQRQPTLRPSKSKIRLIHKPEGAEEEEKVSSPSSIVIPKLKLSALNTTAASHAPPPLSSMRHTRRMTRRSDFTLRLAAKEGNVTYQLLSPISLPTFSFPSAGSPTSHMHPSHRFSMLDPEIRTSLPLPSVGHNGEEGKAAMRRLKEVAVGAGECFITSQLSTLLWHKNHNTAQELALTGCDGEGREMGADEGGYGEGENGWKKRDRGSLSSSPWGQQPSARGQREVTQRDLERSSSNNANGLQPGDLQLFYSATLSLQCILRLIEAGGRGREEAMKGLMCIMTAFIGTFHCRTIGATSELTSALQRLSSAHLRYYEQLMCSAIKACAFVLPSAVMSSGCWQMRVGSDSSANLIPLLSSAGLCLAFPRSFASGSAVCLLPPALLTPSPSSSFARSLSQSTTLQSSPLLTLQLTEEGDADGQSTSITAIRTDDAFYQQQADILQAQVEQMARIQPRTPYDDAVKVLRQTTTTLHLLHHYTTQSSCSRGIINSFATPSFHPIPASFSPSSSCDDCCPCANSIALLLRICGSVLIDLHGQLSRLYRLCKDQAAAGVNPVWSPVVLSASSSSSTLMEVDRLTAVNALISLWISLLSHPSSHSTHSLLARLMRDPTTLPDDAVTHEQVGHESEKISKGKLKSRPSMLDQKVALFSVLHFVHQHALLVYAPSSSAYCLFVVPPSSSTPPRKVLDTVFNSQRASLATTLMNRSSKGGSSGALTGSGSESYATAPSSAHTPVLVEEDEESTTTPIPLHAVVHHARLCVVNFYRAVAWLLQRTTELSEEDVSTDGWETGGKATTVAGPLSTGSEQSSREERVAEEDEEDKEESEDTVDPSDDEYATRESDDDRSEDDSSPRQRRQQRRTRQARGRHSSFIQPADGTEGKSEEDRLAWFWSVMGEVLVEPHGLIARFIHLTVTADSNRTSETTDSDSDDELTMDVSSRSSSSLSSESSDDPASPRQSDRHLSQRLTEFDLLSSYCGLWGDLLAWKGGECPFVSDERLMDSMARFHFVAFIRNYHTQPTLDALRAQTCVLHINLLTAIASAPSLLLTSSSPLPKAKREREQTEDDPSDSIGPSIQQRGTADALCGIMARLRIVHFLSKEMNAEHDIFVARSYLSAALTGGTGMTAATNTAANTARNLAAFSPQASRGGSSLTSPIIRSLAVSPHPSMQLPNDGMALGPATPTFSLNMSRAMTSVLTLHAAANRTDKNSGRLQVNSTHSPLHPLTRHNSNDRPHGEHKRSASSPVHLSPDVVESSLGVATPPSSHPPLSLPLNPNFILSTEPSVLTPLTTHPEEDDGEEAEEKTGEEEEVAAANEVAQMEAQEGEDEEDEAELSRMSGGSLVSMQEETAMRREHADEVEGDAEDVVSEPASTRHSRVVQATASGRPSLIKRSSKYASGKTSPEPRNEEEEEKESEKNEEGVIDDDDDDDLEYEASDISVSVKRTNPLHQFTLSLNNGGDQADAHQTEGEEEQNHGDDDDDDDDMQYDASVLSSARPSQVNEDAPATERPRFRLNIAPAHTPSTELTAEEEKGEEEGEEEDELMNGWSDSESLPCDSHRSSVSGGVKLQLIIPTSAVSATPSPTRSPSTIQHEGSLEIVPSPSTLPATSPLVTPRTNPMISRGSLNVLSSNESPASSTSTSHLVRPSFAFPPKQSDRVTEFSLPKLVTSTPSSSHNAPPSLHGGFRQFHHHSSHSMHLPPLPSSHSVIIPSSPKSFQSTTATSLLDPILPGMPDQSNPQSESPPYLPPSHLLAPSSSALRAPRLSSGSPVMGLQRSTSSNSGAGDEGNSLQQLISFSSSSSSSSSPLAGSGRKSIAQRGKSFGLKLGSALDIYAKRRMQRRFYDLPLLHVAMIRLLLRLLIDPSEACLSHLYCDRSVTAANGKADSDIDVLTTLHSHLNHPLNSSILPLLYSTSLTSHSSPLTRLLKLLCEPLFPSALFLQPNSTQIGRGQFAQVYLAQLPCMESPLAVKQIDMASSAHQRIVLFDLYTEVTVMERMREQQGVVQLMDYGVSRGQYYIVMQAMTKSLKGWREEMAKWRWIGGERKWASKEIASPCFNETQLMLFLFLFRRIISALRALHSSHIVHFDLKLDNVLIDIPSPCEPSTWQVSIADFGESLSIQHGGGSNISRGTENIQSPEMLLLTQVMDAGHHAFDRRRNNVVDAASDVWSLGCLFFELLTNKFLFETAEGLPIVLQVTNQSRAVLQEKDKAMLGTWGGKPNRLLTRFLQSVLVHNKDRRPTLQKVEEMFDAMVHELFPKGLQVSVEGMMSSALGSGVGRHSVDLQKKEKFGVRSLSMQIDMQNSSSALPLLPLSPLRITVGDRHSERTEASSPPPPTAPTPPKVKKLNRLISSRRLSVLPNTPPLSVHFSPLNEELRLPVHSVVPSLYVGARHGKATSLSPVEYFSSTPNPCTHFVHVRVKKSEEDEASQWNASTASTSTLLTFYGWQQISSPVPSAPSARTSRDDSLLLLSSPAEIDAALLFMRTAISLNGRVCVFADSDDAGLLVDDQYDSLRGLCCIYLMAVYGLKWLEAACLLHEKLPIAANPSDAVRLTAAPSSATELGPSTTARRVTRESLFRPSIILPPAAAEGRKGFVGVVGPNSKLSSSFGFASLWPLRIASSLHQWMMNSTLHVNLMLSASYRSFVTSLPNHSSLVTHRCLCGSCLLSCSVRANVRRCLCRSSELSSSVCAAAPLGCRWFVARMQNLFGREGQFHSPHLLWKEVVSTTSPPTPPPSSSPSSSKLASPVPFSQLTALRPVSYPTSSSWQLYECHHCLYPFLAVLPSQSSSPRSPPSLTCTGDSSILCDDVKVQGLQVLANMSVGLDGKEGQGGGFSSSDDAVHHLIDRRSRAFLSCVA